MHRTIHRNDSWTDFFCGSGGSSSGIVKVKGATVAVTPPAARDLAAMVMEAANGSVEFVRAA